MLYFRQMMPPRVVNRRFELFCWNHIFNDRVLLSLCKVSVREVSTWQTPQRQSFCMKLIKPSFNTIFDLSGCDGVISFDSARRVTHRKLLTTISCHWGNSCFTHRVEVGLYPRISSACTAASKQLNPVSVIYLLIFRKKIANMPIF